MAYLKVQKECSVHLSKPEKPLMSDERTLGITTTTLLSLPLELLLHTITPTYPIYSYCRMWCTGWLGQMMSSVGCTAWLRHKVLGAPDQLLTWD